MRVCSALLMRINVYISKSEIEAQDQSSSVAWVQYNHRMDLTDWLLCLGTAIMFSIAGGLLLPPYGWGIGALAAGWLLYRAVKRRRSLNEPKSEFTEKK